MSKTLQKTLLKQVYDKCKHGFIEDAELEQSMKDAIDMGIVASNITKHEFIKLCNLKSESLDQDSALKHTIEGFYQKLLSNKDINVLSSGGNGKIVSLSSSNDNGNNIVFKLIYSGCVDFQREFLVQTRLFNSLQELRELPTLSVDIRIPQPYMYFSKPFSLSSDGESYNCAFAMEKITGYPSELLTDNQECLHLFPYVQALLIFNPRLKNRLFLKDKNQECSLSNPPRYVTLYVDDAVNNNKSKNKLCRDLGIFFGMASFHNKVSLDDVEVIISKNNIVYIVDFGMCQDIQELVYKYLQDPSTYVETLVVDTIASFTTPFITKEGFPTPSNGECWNHFVDGFKESIKHYTTLSQQDIDVLVETLEDAVA